MLASIYPEHDSKALFRNLATDGVIFSQETFRSPKATFYRIALDLIEMYYNDAQMNGLHIDRHPEEKAVELFAGNIVEAGHLFLDNPMETPFIPNWSRVNAAYPDLLRNLREAVLEDNAWAGKYPGGCLANSNRCDNIRSDRN